MRSPTRLKLQGEWAEVCFAARALKLGLVVSKPLGDSAAYDYVVDSGARLLRVQVRSVSRRERNIFQVSAARGARKSRLTSRHIDFLAAWVIPHDVWYIVPVGAIRGRKSIHLAPHRSSRRRYERFREAWELLTHQPV